jgi:chemotaxis protein MotB
VGLGSSHPLTDDPSEAGRAKNRRVELVIEIDPGDEMLGMGLQ